MIRVELTEFERFEKIILDIRFSVFVKEQGVDPEIEIDGLDSHCLHALAFDHNAPIGTGRLLPNKHIGRMAVLAEHRRKGAGGLILQKLIDAAREREWDCVELSSQVHAVPFYERFGFRRFGETYFEAGIDHVHMRLDLSAGRPQAPD